MKIGSAMGFGLVLALVAAGGRALAADSASSALTLNGTAEAVCGFTATPTATPGATNAGLTLAGTAASTVTITDLINDTTAALNSAAITLNYTGLCNYPHYVALQTAKGGLSVGPPVTNSVVGGSFLQRIDYNAFAVWDGVSAGVVTNGTAGAKSNSAQVAGAFSGNLTIQLNINSSTTPVVAGTYTDTLTVQIGQQL